MVYSSIQPIERALSAATTPGQSGPGSNDNEGVLHTPQSSSYLGYSLGRRESYPSAEMQLVYSTALANWAGLQVRKSC